jgi:hypothetical protein
MSLDDLLQSILGAETQGSDAAALGRVTTIPWPICCNRCWAARRPLSRAVVSRTSWAASSAAEPLAVSHCRNPPARLAGVG